MNNHPQEQIEVFKKILLFNDIRRPITVSTLSGYITKGHGLFLACQELGVSEVPIDEQSYESELHELADIQADNALARMSYFNITKMQELSVELDQANIDLEVSGILQHKAEILATQPPPMFSQDHNFPQTEQIKQNNQTFPVQQNENPINQNANVCPHCGQNINNGT